MQKATRIVIGSAAGLAAGLATYHAVYILSAPDFWAGQLSFYYNWNGTFVLGGVLYLAFPLLVLIALSAWRPRPLSLAATIGVPIAWFSFLFFVLVFKPWAYYGEFPWWIVGRDLVPMLGVAFAAGWAFWRGAQCVSLHPSNHADSTQKPEPQKLF